MITPLTASQLSCNRSHRGRTQHLVAATFYGAVGFGHSVELAFKQGLAQLAVEGIPDGQRPDLFTRPGLEASALGAHAAPIIWVHRRGMSPERSCESVRLAPLRRLGAG
jgi:hypothetical protein